MDGIFEFINNNAVLIIAISVIIAMAIIGYVAEKSGFTSKNKSDITIENSIIDDIGHEKIIENNNEIEDTYKEPEIDKNNDKIDINESNEEIEKVNDTIEKPKKENLNIDKDFGELLDDEEILVGDTDEATLNDIDDDLWKF